MIKYHISSNIIFTEFSINFTDGIFRDSIQSSTFDGKCWAELLIIKHWIIIYYQLLTGNDEYIMKILISCYKILSFSHESVLKFYVLSEKLQIIHIFELVVIRIQKTNFWEKVALLKYKLSGANCDYVVFSELHIAQVCSKQCTQIYI